MLRAAVAVELIHSATLVHDDVLDSAALRRGRPTVVATAGRAIATATGDLLFSRAFAELARNGRPDEIRMLSAASSALAEGELLQREDAWVLDVPRERYLHRCDLKTARLFQAACGLGALEGGGAGAALGDFGRRIGLAFQLLDDVLDVSGPAERTGKHRGTDLLDGTVTLPLILARERDPGLAAIDLRAVRTPEQAEARVRRDRGDGRARDWRARTRSSVVAAAKAALPPLPDGAAGGAGARGRLGGRPLRLAVEVHRPDGVRGERRLEALRLLLHVGLGQALEVAHEGLRALVELRVEPVHRGSWSKTPTVCHSQLGQRSRTRHAADDASSHSTGCTSVLSHSGQTWRSRRRRAARVRRGCSVRRLAVEVDDLDRAPGREHYASDIAVVGWLGSSAGSIGSSPYIGRSVQDLSAHLGSDALTDGSALPLRDMSFGPLELVIVLVIVLLLFGGRGCRSSAASWATACASSRTPSRAGPATSTTAARIARRRRPPSAVPSSEGEPVDGEVVRERR